MAEWNSEEVRSAIAEMTKKTRTDAELRSLCLSDPVGAIKKATDKDLPEGFTVKFVEGGGADMTFVLPDLVSAEGELSDKDLEKVAGGKHDTYNCTGVSSVG